MAGKRSTVSVILEKSGIKPPVYLAGSFSAPAWQPVPMQYSVGPDGNYRFYANIELEGGSEYQYKFRVGEGHWILDEKAPTVTDDQGNRNNLLTIPSNKSERDKMSGNWSSLVQLGGGMAPKEPPPYPALGVTPGQGRGVGRAATEIQDEADRVTSFGRAPDQVTVACQTPTYSADTAAEVADSAACLDIEQATPPITDEAAGRIGFRRLSQTPIKDVAEVASEVSDSAALLDTEEQALRIDMPPPFAANGSTAEIETPGSGEVTPWEDRAPRFAHECVCLPEAGEVQAQSRGQHRGSPAERSSGDEGSIDLNDPSIEEFPCDRELILQRVRTSATRLSEDETVWEALAACPGVAGNHQADRSSEGSSSPDRVADEVRAPSLGSIPEEHALEEHSAATSHTRKQAGSKGSFDGKRDELVAHKEQHETASEAYEPNSAAHKPVSELTHNTVRPSTSGVDIQGTTSEAPSKGGGTPKVQTRDGAHTDAESFQSLPGNPDSHHPSIDTEGYEDLLLPGHWPVANAQLSGDTPGLRARTSRPVADAAGSTGVDSSSRSHSTTRKSGSPPLERPLTPTSVRSVNFLAQSRALLRNFLRMIFVDWIGGVFRRLCRRRRA